MRKWWAGCLCLFAAACSSSEDYGNYPPFPVSGQLTINGKPEKGVNLVFHLDGYVNDGKAESRTVLPQAWTDENGHFVLSTYKNADGAPAGDYHISVKWPMKHNGMGPGPDALGEKFANATTSGLTAHVEKSSNELQAMNLTVNLEETKPGGKRVIKKGVFTKEVQDK